MGFEMLEGQDAAQGLLWSVPIPGNAQGDLGWARSSSPTIPFSPCSGNGKLASWTSILGFVVMMSLDVGLG